ncbi:hypothetical protein N0V93_005715 [Gnomoniopsis smithogilvyi]|uniref:Uncharacterized protein n=1 Tax=Gnomoniopsis smithogilvyi TaxID=1191159 RepID=A0A9W8YV86_9PEZI|nr:hypothetical protein N0V93_005715 [Gnomoniopsis smithogilvyi]
MISLQPLIFFTAVIGMAVAIETHGGVQFDVRWTNTSSPLDNPIKDAYETAAAKQVYERLQGAIHATNITSDCLSSGNSTPAGVYVLKDCMVAEHGSGVFFDLLADDIAEADKFWKQVVEESSTNVTEYIPARTYVRGFFGDSLNATEFAIWTASPFSDAEDLHANPEHYFINSTVASVVSESSEIFEGWGGVLSSFGSVRTNFTVPDFSTPAFGTADYPWAWSLNTAFPLAFQRIGHKKLSDGTTFGVLHIAIRDFAANETSIGISGIEVYAAVWYPSWDQGCVANKTEFANNFLPDESHHMVQEIIADTLKAKSDCASGLCVVSS